VRRFREEAAVALAVVRPVRAVDGCAFVSVCWRVRAAGPPAAIRECPRCDQRGRFVSSGLFRMNASGRRLDVWLIYRCERCDFTWKRTVEERRSVAELGARFVLYERNDPVLARAVACDVAGLAREGVPVEAEEPRVERPTLGTPPGLSITFAVDPGCAVRLDRLLARELGVSRRALEEAAAAGVVAVDGDVANALRRSVRDGLRVRVVTPLPGARGSMP
jgi:hypothetical protein